VDVPPQAVQGMFDAYCDRHGIPRNPVPYWKQPDLEAAMAEISALFAAWERLQAQFDELRTIAEAQAVIRGLERGYLIRDALAPDEVARLARLRATIDAIQAALTPR
jgi:hypothetical protein